VSSGVNLQDRFFDGVEQGQQEQEDEQGRKSLRKILIFSWCPLAIDSTLASSGKGFPSAIRGEVAGKCAAQYLTLRGY
jgi:hypothetical protein